MNKKPAEGKVGSLGAARRAYHAPRVLDYGDLAVLTKTSAKNGTKTDSGTNTRH